MVEPIYCVHCGAVAKHPVTKTIQGQVLHFCCKGCLQIYEMMHEEGLPPEQNQPAPSQANNSPLPSQSVTFSVEGMSCANCVFNVERGLRSVPGVMHVQVSLETGLAQVAIVTGKVTMTDLYRAVEKAGYFVPQPRKL